MLTIFKMAQVLTHQDMDARITLFVAQRMTDMEARLDLLEVETADMKGRTADLKVDTADMKARTADLEVDTADMKARTADLEGRMSVFEMLTQPLYVVYNVARVVPVVSVVLSASSVPRVGKRAAVRRLHRADLVREMAGMLAWTCDFNW